MAGISRLEATKVRRWFLLQGSKQAEINNDSTNIQHYKDRNIPAVV